MVWDVYRVHKQCCSRHTKSLHRWQAESRMDVMKRRADAAARQLRLLSCKISKCAKGKEQTTSEGNNKRRSLSQKKKNRILIISLLRIPHVPPYWRSLTSCVYFPPSYLDSTSQGPHRLASHIPSPTQSQGSTTTFASALALHILSAPAQ